MIRRSNLSIRKALLRGAALEVEPCSGVITAGMTILGRITWSRGAVARRRRAITRRIIAWRQGGAIAWSRSAVTRSRSAVNRSRSAVTRSRSAVTRSRSAVTRSRSAVTRSLRKHVNKERNNFVKNQISIPTYEIKYVIYKNMLWSNYTKG